MRVYWLEAQYEFREWDFMMIQLVSYLKDKYEAKIITQKGGVFYINEFNCVLSDCEIFIYDEDKDQLKGISFSDNPSDMINVFIQRDRPNDLFVSCQFHNQFPIDFKNPHRFTISEGTFYGASAVTNYDFFYYKRLLLSSEILIDKMFFMGTDRPDLEALREQGLCSENQRLTHSDYLHEAIKYKIGLSIVGVGELCHRDIENLAIGLPILRFELMTQLNPPLIPNHHYISINRESKFPYDTNIERSGGPEYVEAYRRRFLEVKDDNNFLEFISKNGRDYYFKYLHSLNRIEHVRKLMGL